MDFFKSILSDDPEPAANHNPQGSKTNPVKNLSPQHEDDGVDESNANTNFSGRRGGGGWSFEGLVKTLTSTSESVLETYRRDLKEFGSGLKKETDLFREAASRAVKELPASIEVSASAIDGVLRSTADIISQGKDSLLAPSDLESSASETHNYNDQSSNSRRYSRFESQLVAIQNDMRTYCEEPDDLDDYSKWRQGFVLEDKRDEVENLVEYNGPLNGIYNRVVPNEIDDNTFWCRYFYRVHKLKQQEDMRAKLVRRSLSIDDEEDLTWDIDDDEEEEANDATEANILENKELSKKDLSQIAKKESFKEEPGIGSSRDADEDVEPSDENATDEKVDNGESCKDSDVSVVSTQPSMQEEEDLGWDEIEDLGSNDENKVSQDESPNKADVRKRLSAAEDEEDLNWDIEDDEEPVKA